MSEKVPEKLDASTCCCTKSIVRGLSLSATLVLIMAIAAGLVVVIFFTRGDGVLDRQVQDHKPGLGGYWPVPDYFLTTARICLMFGLPLVAVATIANFVCALFDKISCRMCLAYLCCHFALLLVFFIVTSMISDVR